jgi:hypothetical protein
VLGALALTLTSLRAHGCDCNFSPKQSFSQSLADLKTSFKWRSWPLPSGDAIQMHERISLDGAMEGW